MKANKQMLNESFKRFQPLPNWPGLDRDKATDVGGESKAGNGRAAYEEEQDEATCAWHPGWRSLHGTLDAGSL